MADIFTSRKFWTSVIAVAVVIVNHFHKFIVDEDALTGLMMLLSSYVVGLAFDPGPLEGKFKAMLTSKKFWSTLIGSVFMIVEGTGVKIPIDPQYLIYTAAAISAYILGSGINDFRAHTHELVAAQTPAPVESVG